jgi:hypothetical protein
MPNAAPFPRPPQSHAQAPSHTHTQSHPALHPETATKWKRLWQLLLAPPPEPDTATPFDQPADGHQPGAL